jgi:hypothetical protein
MDADISFFLQAPRFSPNPYPLSLLQGLDAELGSIPKTREPGFRKQRTVFGSHAGAHPPESPITARLVVGAREPHEGQPRI